MALFFKGRLYNCISLSSSFSFPILSAMATSDTFQQFQQWRLALANTIEEQRDQSTPSLASSVGFSTFSLLLLLWQRESSSFMSGSIDQLGNWSGISDLDRQKFLGCPPIDGFSNSSSLSSSPSVSQLCGCVLSWSAFCWDRFHLFCATPFVCEDFPSSLPLWFCCYFLWFLWYRLLG